MESALGYNKVIICIDNEILVLMIIEQKYAIALWFFSVTLADEENINAEIAKSPESFILKVILLYLYTEKQKSNMNDDRWTL